MRKPEKNKRLFSPEDIASVPFEAAAAMVRYNTLVSIYQAGSGHIGASFSAIDIMLALYRYAFNPNTDRFVLSKGHAAAGLYAVLAAQGYFPTEQLLTFRQFGGLPGHVDVSVPGVDSSTGSLGMGISKAKGYAWTTRGRAFVLVGDGELQEGQNWEAIQSAGRMKLGNLIMIVDCNKYQTDRRVSEFIDMVPLRKRLESFGWLVSRLDGHSINHLAAMFGSISAFPSKQPIAVLADTMKGKGVSFMEPMAGVRYKWHNAIPDSVEMASALCELTEPLLSEFKGEFPTWLFEASQPSAFSGFNLLKPAFTDCLLNQKNAVVLDADLSDDCGLRPFEKRYPSRFIECGIAEQDMVSMAGSIARRDWLPIVNSYAAFLTSRANEQIFNNCCEGDKVIYAGHLAGLLPSKPGKSHQAIRDISLLSNIPNLVMAAPSNSTEMKAIFKYMAAAGHPSYLRIEHSVPRLTFSLPKNYRVKPGIGCVFGDGEDVAIITYGALMMSECLDAVRLLEKRGIHARLINLPWLNRVDKQWYTKAVCPCPQVVCVENHSADGGQSAMLARLRYVTTIGVEGFAQSGDNESVLKHYGLDRVSIANRIERLVK